MTEYQYNIFESLHEDLWPLTEDRNILLEKVTYYEHSKWTPFNLQNSYTWPPYDVPVIVCVSSGNVFSFTFHGIDDDDSLPYWQLAATEDRTLLSVTHWQHMPPPPL